MSINLTKSQVFKELVCVRKIGQVTAEEELKLAKSIGKVTMPETERELKLHKQFKGELPGILNVTEGALFGHKEVLDWHVNKPSNLQRQPIIWLYAKKGSKGSVTSWINNKKSYEDLPQSKKEECANVKFTCGYSKGKYSNESTFNEHHNKDCVQSLVYTNEYGHKGLFFPFNQIMEGISKDLFEYLKNHILQDKYRYDHHWEDGDVVISEQSLTIHKRWPFENMKERVLHRIAIS
jgi:taurine dioxygenase